MSLPMSVLEPLSRPPTVAPAVRPGTPWRWWQALFFFVIFWRLAPYDLAESTKMHRPAMEQLNEATASSEQGNPARRATLLTLGGFSLLCLLQRGGRRLRVRSALAWAVLFFSVWCVLSPLWADDPLLSARKILVFGCMCLGALAVATQFDPREHVLFAMLALLPFVLTGLGAELTLGTFRPSDPDYRFGGLAHPNAMGTACALLVIAAVAYGRMRGGGRWLGWSAAALGLILLFLTKSRTAALAGMVSAAILLIASLQKRTRFVLAGAAIVVVTVLVIADVDVDTLAQHSVVLGRTDTDAAEALTLTGRLQIWDQLDEYVRQRPLLGYGYDGFWSANRLLEVALRQKFAVTATHSGYFEIALNLGLVGLTLYLLMCWLAVRKAWSQRHRNDWPATLFLVGALLCLYVNSLTENIMLRASVAPFLCMTIFARLAFVEPDDGETAGGPGR